MDLVHYTMVSVDTFRQALAHALPAAIEVEGRSGERCPTMASQLSQPPRAIPD